MRVWVQTIKQPIRSTENLVRRHSWTRRDFIPTGTGPAASGAAAKVCHLRSGFFASPAIRERLILSSWPEARLN
jgi:hypothetical protein